MGTVVTALLVMVSISCLSYLLLQTISDISTRYKNRYLEETSSDINDIFLQMPAKKLLDLNLVFSVIIGVLLILIYVLRVRDVEILHVVILGGIGFVASFPVPKIILRIMKKRRLKKFNEQLEEALGTISSSLKAGFSINQAFDELAMQNKPPISIEFSLLVQEIRLGVSMETALENMNKRLNSSDFDLVVTAIITARQTGGELTSTLERLAALIRERMRITNKLNAMTAMGRLQALLIAIMPFLLLWGMFQVSPNMVKAFFDTPIGFFALIVVIVLDVIGFLVIKKITTIDV